MYTHTHVYIHTKRDESITYTVSSGNSVEVSKEGMGRRERRDGGGGRVQVVVVYIPRLHWGLLPREYLNVSQLLAGHAAAAASRLPPKRGAQKSDAGAEVSHSFV